MIYRTVTVFVGSSACLSRSGRFDYYRAIHCSAKCGIEITCRPSVCLSVTLMDQEWHIVLKILELHGSKSKSKITPATSPLFCNHKHTLLLVSTLHEIIGGTRKIWSIDTPTLPFLPNF